MISRERGEEEMASATETTKTAQEKRSGDHAFVKGVHGVRYQVKDVARSVAFYTTHLGFTANTSSFQPSATCRSAMRTSCSAGLRRRDLGPRRMASSRHLADGIALCFAS